MDGGAAAISLCAIFDAMDSDDSGSCVVSLAAWTETVSSMLAEMMLAHDAPFDRPADWHQLTTQVLLCLPRRAAKAQRPLLKGLVGLILTTEWL